jgi:hypothetical protein
MSIRVAVTTPSPIEDVSSPSHPHTARVRLGDAVSSNDARNKALVTLESGDGQGLGGDLVVIVRQEAPHQPRVWVETYFDDRVGEVEEGKEAEGGDEGVGAPCSTAIMVALYPDLSSLGFRRVSSQC